MLIFLGRALVVCLLLASVLSLGCSKSPIARAQAFLDAGMPSQAVPLLQLEIQADPKNGRAHLMLGQASLMLNDQAGAKESLDRAILLNPDWAEKVGRSYLDAANKLITGDMSEVRLAASYLETAREKTRALDKDIARSLRRAGLKVGSDELLRSAVQTDPSLAMDDSVAASLAMASNLGLDQRIAAMEGFLESFPKSSLRPIVLVRVAQAEVEAGNRPKAKAYAQEVLALPGDPEAGTEARALLEQIAGVERTEAEAGTAARQADARTQAALARQKLIEQEAQARSARSAADARTAQAVADSRAAQAMADARAAQSQADAEARTRELETARLAVSFVGLWTDNGGDRIEVTREHAGMRVRYLSSGRTATGALVDAQSIRIRFDGNCCEGTLVSSRSIRWSNGTTWTRSD